MKLLFNKFYAWLCLWLTATFGVNGCTGDCEQGRRCTCKKR
jgi:hypothetical protein